MTDLPKIVLPNLTCPVCAARTDYPKKHSDWHKRLGLTSADIDSLKDWA